MKPLKLSLWVLGMLLFSLAGVVPPAAAAPVATAASAGWAEVEITPPPGIALGGRGAVMTVSKQVLDPLRAQVLYLEDGKETRFVLASLDVVGLPHELSDRIRKAVVQELGVDWNLVVLNCSHTHSGPNMLRSLVAGAASPPEIETDYFNALTDKLVQAARAAARTRTPVKIEVFEGTSEIAINRRGRNKDGKIGMLPNASGPFDEKLWVMKLTPLNGRAPAIVFSYACHPVIVYGYAFAGISADFPGVTRNALRERLGAKVHAQFVQGLAGNVRPRVLADLQQNRFRAAGPEDVLQAGNELARDVMAALKTRGRTLTLNLAGAMDRPFLPRDKPPSAEVYEKMARDDSNANLQAAARYWLQRYDSGEGFAKGDAWPVGLIRLADEQWIVYFAGEPCVEWRAKLSRWLSPRNLVTWGYTQEANTYLPTEALLPEGGYEVLESNRARASSPAPFAPGIERAVRESLLRQLAWIEAKVR